MLARVSKAQDTTTDWLIGLVRTAAGVALLTHAAMIAHHDYRYMETLRLGPSLVGPYCVFAIEIALAVILAADFLFRIACTAGGVLLLVLMLVILVGEHLGVSDHVRRYPVALFLICLTGLFTGIGEFALLGYLKHLPHDGSQSPPRAATIS